jgi:hypothetical protein
MLQVKKSRMTQQKNYPIRDKYIMRGSVYYQTGKLVRAIFREGAKKHEKADVTHHFYKCVSSFKTMETYRNVWNNLGNYLKEHWKLKDFEKITSEHIDAYILYKIEYYPSRQYLEKIISAIGKLEWALMYLSMELHNKEKIYDFETRHNQLHYAKVQGLVSEGYNNRTYDDAEEIISCLSAEKHKIAAKIQLFGGARSEGVILIKKEQLREKYYIDNVTGEKVSLLLTKEKGGKEGEVHIPTRIYEWLEDYFARNEVFKLSYQTYSNDIKQACESLGVVAHGSHGFRWTFAQNRVRIYQNYGYSYEQALQGVSWEMKHFRASITEHYLG